MIWHYSSTSSGTFPANALTYDRTYHAARSWRGPIWCTCILHFLNSACRRAMLKVLINVTFVSDFFVVRKRRNTNATPFFCFANFHVHVVTKSIQRLLKHFVSNIQPCSKLLPNPSPRRLHNKSQEYNKLLGPSQPTALPFTPFRRTVSVWWHQNQIENVMVSTQATLLCRRHKVFNQLQLVQVSRLSVLLWCNRNRLPRNRWRPGNLSSKLCTPSRRQLKLFLRLYNFNCKITFWILNQTMLRPDPA